MNCSLPNSHQEMKRLAKRADIITPNLTELCLLADADPGMAANREDAGAEGDGAENGGAGDNRRRLSAGGAGIVDTAEKLARHVMQGGTERGGCYGGSAFGQLGWQGNDGESCGHERPDTVLCAAIYRRGLLRTGDLFASVIAAGRPGGMTLAEDVKLAGEMIARAIQDAVRDRVPRDEGAEYEKYLPLLMKSGSVGELLSE